MKKETMFPSLASPKKQQKQRKYAAHDLQGLCQVWNSLIKP
jgi:hypothetical protein